MFYLKYRPQKFSELIKPNLVGDALANQVKTGKVSHAYLFTGSRGTGKTTTARILAKAVNCLAPEKNGDPCDTCANCVAIREGSFLDLIEIDAASNRGIDDIRSLRDRIKLAPAHGKKKVYIIDEVHMLTTEAFNALLKTLEEPPAHAMFILCTTEVSKVPDTIKSRCQGFTFRRASLKQLKEKLKGIAVEEGNELSDKDAEEIARASLGGYRDAETMLQQVLQGNSSVDSLASSGSYEDFSQFFSFLLEVAPNKALPFIEEKVSQGVDMQVWVGSFLNYLKDLLFLKMSVTDGFDDLPDEILETMKGQCQRLPVNDLIFATNLFLKCENALSVELAVAEICTKWGGDFDGDLPDTPLQDTPKPKPTPSVSKTPKKKEEVKPEREEGTDAETPQKEVPAETSIVEESVSEEALPEAPTEITIDLETIKKEWNNILRASTKYNHSVRALLKATQPLEIVGNTLVLEARFAFHKDRLEYSKNREIVEQVLFEILNEPLIFECKLCQTAPIRKSFGETGNLTDLNIVIPDREELTAVNIDSSLLDVFDGGLPL